jgi:hypothetical protein
MLLPSVRQNWLFFSNGAAAPPLNGFEYLVEITTILGAATLNLN